MKHNRARWFFIISIALSIGCPSNGQFVESIFNTVPAAPGQTFQVNSALLNSFNGGTANQLGQQRYQELVKYTPYYVEDDSTPGISIATLLLLGLLYGIVSMTSSNQSDMMVTMLSVGMGTYIGYGFGGGRGRGRGGGVGGGRGGSPPGGDNGGTGGGRGGGGPRG